MTHRNVDDLIREWTDLGEEQLPDRYLQAALAEIEVTPQSGTWPAPVEGLIMRLRSTAPYLMVAAAIVLAVAGYFAFLAPSVGDQGPSPAPAASATVPATPSPSEVGELTPRTVATSVIDIGGALTGLRATEDAVYAATEDRIVRIDPETGGTTALFTVPDADTSCSDCKTGPEYAFAVGEGSVWVAYHYEVQSVVRRFDMDTGELQAEILVGTPQGGGAGTTDITVAFGSVWTVQCQSGTVARIDPASNQQVALIPFAEGAVCLHPFAIAAHSDGSLWASAITDDGTAIRGSIHKLDPATNTSVGSVMVEGPATPCGRFASDPDASWVWINSCPESEYSSLIRLTTGDLEAVPVGPADSILLSGYLGDPGAFGGRLWVPQVSGRPLGSAVLVGLDPASGEILDLIQLGSETPVIGRSAIAMVDAFDSVWVGGDAGTVLRIPLSELNP